jgi:hypothetical protein
MTEVYYYVRKDKNGSIVSGGRYGGPVVYGDERDIGVIRMMDEQQGVAQDWRGTSIEIVSEEVAMPYLNSVGDVGRYSRKKRRKKRRK